MKRDTFRRGRSHGASGQPSRAFSSSFWRFGLAAGAFIAGAVTVVVTVWEWVENPGGIFRGSGGTHWGFVWETAASWFVPTFAYTAVAVAAAHLLVSGVRRAYRVVRQQGRPREDA